MITLLIILHVILCLFLILIVLLQAGKGAEIGAAFGVGASQTLFGPRGAASFMHRLTTIVAALFILTSFSLTIISAKAKKPTIIKKVVKETQKEKAKLPPIKK